MVLFGVVGKHLKFLIKETLCYILSAQDNVSCTTAVSE